jgi:hypothetical protein
MKRLIQLNLLLLLVTSAAAQESPTQNPPKVLRTYDWKDLNVQSINCQIVLMDGISVLKIENTNNTRLEISLLTIKNPPLIKKASSIQCEWKCENVRQAKSFTNGITSKYDARLIWSKDFPPEILGGDARTNETWISFSGTINWGRNGFGFSSDFDQTKPTEANFKLSLPSIGTVYLRPIKLLGTASSSNWWTPEQGGMIGGIGGAIIGCFGALTGMLASRGKARKLVLALTKVFIVLGIFLLLAGAVAAAIKQPYLVYYPLLLAGFILTIVFSINLPSIQRRYDELEIRRMTSVDTMRS